MIRVVLPTPLRSLAAISGEVELPLEGAVTTAMVLDALETRYPVLRGTIRDSESGRRRPFLRFFAEERDLSHDSLDLPLPEVVVSGHEPFIVLGAIAGG